LFGPSDDEFCDLWTIEIIERRSQLAVQPPSLFECGPNHRFGGRTGNTQSPPDNHRRTVAKLWRLTAHDDRVELTGQPQSTTYRLTRGATASNLTGSGRFSSFDDHEQSILRRSGGFDAAVRLCLSMDSFGRTRRGNEKNNHEQVVLKAHVPSWVEHQKGEVILGSVVSVPR
jgi:hypothetical protein